MHPARLGIAFRGTDNGGPAAHPPSRHHPQCVGSRDMDRAAGEGRCEVGTSVDRLRAAPGLTGDPTYFHAKPHGGSWGGGMTVVRKGLAPKGGYLAGAR